MTSDCYAILGVTPTAEDVVIGAAYRALMRHYHPDTNPDPKAQARAQEISAAYAVLRDPAKRAQYDSSRGAGGILWPVEEPAEAPPPMRTAGIATAALAVLLVGAVWAWPRPSDAPPDGLAEAARPAPGKPAPPVAPSVRPERAEAASAATSAESRARRGPSAEPADDVSGIAAPRPPRPVKAAGAEPVRPIARAAPPQPAPPTQTQPARPVAAKSEGNPPGPKPAADQRLTTLDRMSDSFFSQSMVHASGAKKELLLAARDRSAAQRKACRSDSCVADAYVREIRETGAIMEGRAGPK